MHVPKIEVNSREDAEKIANNNYFLNVFNRFAESNKDVNKGNKELFEAFLLGAQAAIARTLYSLDEIEAITEFGDRQNAASNTAPNTGEL